MIQQLLAMKLYNKMNCNEKKVACKTQNILNVLNNNNILNILNILTNCYSC